MLFDLQSEGLWLGYTMSQILILSKNFKKGFVEPGENGSPKRSHFKKGRLSKLWANFEEAKQYLD